jgi:3-phenylpropionate/cinnamic acid dioxygenase small subunit
MIAIIEFKKHSQIRRADFSHATISDESEIQSMLAQYEEDNCFEIEWIGTDNTGHRLCDQGHLSFCSTFQLGCSSPFSTSTSWT